MASPVAMNEWIGFRADEDMLTQWAGWFAGAMCSVWALRYGYGARCDGKKSLVWGIRSTAGRRHDRPLGGRYDLHGDQRLAFLGAVARSRDRGRRAPPSGSDSQVA